MFGKHHFHVAGKLMRFVISSPVPLLDGRSSSLQFVQISKVGTSRRDFLDLISMGSPVSWYNSIITGLDR